MEEEEVEKKLAKLKMSNPPRELIELLDYLIEISADLRERLDLLEGHVDDEGTTY